MQGRRAIVHRGSVHLVQVSGRGGAPREGAGARVHKIPPPLWFEVPAIIFAANLRLLWATDPLQSELPNCAIKGLITSTSRRPLAPNLDGSLLNRIRMYSSSATFLRVSAIETNFSFTKLQIASDELAESSMKLLPAI